MTDEPTVLIGYLHLYNWNLMVVAYADSLCLQHLSILELEQKLPAIEPRIVHMDYPMVVRADDNDVRRVVVLRVDKSINVFQL